MSVIDDDTFQGMMIRAVSMLGLVEVATQLKVSKPTVERWTKGTNLPHMALRPSIQNWADRVVP